MKKQLLILGILLVTATMAFGATTGSVSKAAVSEQEQDRLIDQLTILKIQMDTFLDLSQLDRLLQEARDIVSTFESMKTSAPQGSMEFKTLTANRNGARELMLRINSIYRRRALSPVAQQ